MAETEVTGLRIALADDEQIYLDGMSEICREFAAENRPEIEISGFSDGGGFLRSEEDFSIVFMDIYTDGSAQFGNGDKKFYADVLLKM